MPLFDGDRGAEQHLGGEERNSDQSFLWPCGALAEDGCGVFCA